VQTAAQVTWKMTIKTVICVPLRHILLTVIAECDSIWSDDDRVDKETRWGNVYCQQWLRTWCPGL